MTGPASRLLALGHALRVEGRLDDALTIFEHLTVLDAGDPEAVRGLVAALGARGRTLEALHKLMAFKALQADTGPLLSLIREQALPAVARFNAHLQAGEVDQAEPYAAALAALIPQGAPMLAAAMDCNHALGRAQEAERYARALLEVEPAHAGALAIVATAVEAEEVHPLLRLRDLHDAASAILCGTLTDEGVAEVERLQAAARALDLGEPSGEEWSAWEKHYRLLLDGVDMAAVTGPTPQAPPEPEVVFATSSGAPLTRDGLKAHAARLGAEVVFFAAADEAYVDQYARLYALSVLKHCEVPFLVVAHVIGGAGRLKAIARAVGIRDDRLAFAADGFDAEAVTTRCHDAPPKGLIAKPVAHLQSVRFLRLGALIQTLGLPVFVSDIDLLLQRGVRDLLEAQAGTDLVLNENHQSPNAGSRITANLLLVNPTPNAGLFLRFLGTYLETELGKAEVTRWIDQLSLVMARHHLLLRGSDSRIGYFDTSSDINNVMYPSFQANPFRFLSLYHGFDTSSLEPEENARPRPRKRKAA